MASTQKDYPPVRFKAPAARALLSGDSLDPMALLGLRGLFP